MHALVLLFLLNTTSVPVTPTQLQLDISVDYKNDRIDGSERLTVKNITDAPVVALPLMVNRLMTVKSAKSANGSPLAVEQDVVLFSDDSKMQADFANVTLASPLAPGDTTSITVEYGGHLTGYVETGSLYIKDHIDETFTMIREDAFAFPVLAVPSHHINRRRPLPSFTFDVRVNVPSGLIVAAGGTLADTHEANGRTTFHFTSSQPVPFVNIGVAKYKVLDAANTRIYYLGDSDAGAKIVLDRTLTAEKQLATWLGPLPGAPHVTIIEIPDDYGPQADPIAGIILESWVFRDHNWFAGLYHEIAHFWNGHDKDVPSSRWPEGVSTWFQDVMPEVLDNKPWPKFSTRTIEKLSGRISEDEQLRRVPLRDYGKEDIGGNSYTVGFLYFKIVERVIGRDALLSVMRDYYQSRDDTLAGFTSLLAKRYPQTRAITSDWIDSAKWAEMLPHAQSLDALVTIYAPRVSEAPH